MSNQLRRDLPRTRLLAPVWSLLFPLAGALAAVRYLAPSTMEGRSGGALAYLGGLADRHPLALVLALFLVLSAIARYWWRRLPQRWLISAGSVRPAAAVCP